MQVNRIEIEQYRSIENITLNMPKDKPLILFGPNNAGKSNILSAIDRLLGERYPTYFELEDSDYFLRDKDNYPQISISAEFSEVFSKGKNYVTLTYGYNNQINNNIFHDGQGNKMYVSNDERARMQSFLLDADRNAGFHFNYSNRFSLLSKFNKSLHDSLNQCDKDRLEDSFEEIKNTFESKEEYSALFNSFKESVSESVKGFMHHLDVDFSAYDPNNYANVMRISAFEDDSARTFEEFGTGEQQILLMAFAKAYMEAFKGERFLLILEEPEANLHPLAQKWLKKYIYEISESGIQVIISTHSPYFVDINNLEGLVRVYKDDKITKAKQVNKDELKDLLMDTGVPSHQIDLDSINEFFASRLYSEQLEGMFAEIILLVEGPTEKLSIPLWLEKEDCFLPKEGIEIVNCMGKTNIPLLYRIYKMFDYKCFAIFDSDLNRSENSRNNHLLDSIFKDCSIPYEEDYYVGENYISCKNNIEETMKSQLDSYSKLEENARNQGIDNKQGIAKYLAINSSETPEVFISLKGLLLNNHADHSNGESLEDIAEDEWSLPF